MTNVRKTLRTAAAVSCALMLAGACSKVPSDIIQPHDMAELMADVHIGESVVEMNRGDYRNDSLKQLMKQSVYARHGYTTAQVDSSFLWYGRNIKYYMDVYDETIEILERRLIESGNRIAAANALSIAGDSVDVWPGARYVIVNDRMPSKIVTFSFEQDPNWEHGDNYTWRAKFFNSPEEIQWLIGTEYADGSVEYLHESPGGDGWHEIKLQTDSTLEPVRIFGYLNVHPRTGTDLRLDSIEMVRKRVNSNDYRRPYTVFRRGFYPASESKPDSASVAADSVK